MVEIENFYKYEFFKSFGEGLINPFITIFALTLGASNFLIGSLSGTTSVACVVSQLILSFLLLKVKRKGRILILATFFWSLMWIVIGFSRNPYQLIAFLSIQAIFSASITLSWTDFLVNSIPGYKRGEFISRLNWWNGFGAILATFASGYFLTKYGFIPFVFFVAAIFGVLASLSVLSLKNVYLPTIELSKVGVKESLWELKKNKNFLALLKARTFLRFAVGIASPFFAVYVVTQLGGSTMDVAIISIISSVLHLLFYKPWGFVVDFVGRKATMLSCILLISVHPLVYVMAPNVFFLYFFIIFAAIGWAGFDIAAFAYFSDVAEKKNVFQLTALYNFSIETFGIIANFLGGILAQNFGVFKVFIISFILRLASLIFFMEIEERTGYKEMVKFGTTHHPFHFVQESVTIYSILFSTLRRDMIRRKEFFDRLKRFFTYILKKIGLT
jgi:MFS family permease